MNSDIKRVQYASVVEVGTQIETAFLTLMSTEADTCRKFILPKLYAAGWTDDLIGKQRPFTDESIPVRGTQAHRLQRKHADYLLLLQNHFPLAVVETKAAYKKNDDGLQQAKDYVNILGLKFAYANIGYDARIRDDYSKSWFDLRDAS